MKCIPNLEVFIPDLPRFMCAFDGKDGFVHMWHGFHTGCGREEHLTIPYGTAVVPKDKFIQCVELVSVDVPETVTALAPSAFISCINLSRVTLPKGLLKIGDSCFNGCKALTYIAIPESVTEIESGAFDNTGIHRIILREGIKKLGQYVFQDKCDITFTGSEPPEINDSFGVDATIHVPKGCEEKYKAAFGGDYAKYIVS